MKTSILALLLSLFFLGCISTPSPLPTSNPTNVSITPTPALSPSFNPTSLPGAECKTASDCKVAGCSSQLCVSKNAKDVVTTCEYKEEYSCYGEQGCGCVLGKCSWSPETLACVFQSTELAAIRECISACEKQKSDLNASGPCISQQIATGWVCDVAHSPRIELDDDPINQCAEYGRSASHFVEITPDCKLIRTR